MEHAARTEGCEFQSAYLKAENHLEDLRVDVKIKLKYILKKLTVSQWTEFISLFTTGIFFVLKGPIAEATDAPQP